jgi:predicted phosphodiesterase
VEETVAYKAVNPAAGARIVFIGDIHGCYEELVELLARVEPRDNDLLVSVGDVVSKGPAPAKCLDLWKERRYLAVQGNNEVRLLEEDIPIIRFFARENSDVLRRKDLLRYIARWPRFIDFPEAAVAAVHGGLLPQTEITAEAIEEQKDLIHHLRWIRRKNGGWKYVPKEKKRKDDVLWSEKWKGDRFVVYGHTPLREPKFDRAALGLDTGCVYGGWLSAAIWDKGEWTTTRVAAKRKYAE